LTSFPFPWLTVSLAPSLFFPPASGFFSFFFQKRGRGFFGAVSCPPSPQTKHPPLFSPRMEGIFLSLLFSSRRLIWETDCKILWRDFRANIHPLFFFSPVRHFSLGGADSPPDISLHTGLNQFFCSLHLPKFFPSYCPSFPFNNRNGFSSSML